MSKDKLIPELRFPEFFETWEINLLSDVCDVYRGSTFSKADIDEKGSQSCIHYGELFTKYNEVISTIYSKTNKKEGFKSKIGDILMPSSDVTPDGLVKASALMLDNVVLGGDMNILRPKKKFSSIFLSYLLNHSKKEIIKLVSGTTVKHIYSSQIITCQLPIVNNTSEQQKIASCLSSLDEVIAAHSQKLELLKDHKKGLMQNLFPQEGEKVPKYRFKEFEKDEEWVDSRIGDFIESHKGGAPLSPSDFVDSSDFEVIPKKAINEGGLLNMSVTRPTYCTEIFYKKNMKSVVDSSFLITTLRDLVPSGPSIGYIVKFNGTKKYILAQGVYGLKPKNTIVPDFLIQFSNTLRYRKLVNAAMVGSTQVHIRNSEFFNLPIQVPKMQEQQKIASCLSTLDALITSQSEKIEQLKLHKKGLMQGLFPKIKE